MKKQTEQNYDHKIWLRKNRERIRKNEERLSNPNYLSPMKKLTLFLILLSGAMMLVGVVAMKWFPVIPYEVTGPLTLFGFMLLTGMAVLAGMFKGG